jgi:hypothetical protein
VLKTKQAANLIHHLPSAKYYARICMRGKLIVKSLETTSISVAKLRLSGLMRLTVGTTPAAASVPRAVADSRKWLEQHLAQYQQ